jgi:hypothetical protein
VPAITCYHPEKPCDHPSIMLAITRRSPCYHLLSSCFFPPPHTPVRIAGSAFELGAERCHDPEERGGRAGQKHLIRGVCPMHIDPPCFPVRVCSPTHGKPKRLREECKIAASHGNKCFGIKILRRR